MHNKNLILVTAALSQILRIYMTSLLLRLSAGRFMLFVHHHFTEDHRKKKNSRVPAMEDLFMILCTQSSCIVIALGVPRELRNLVCVFFTP